MTLSGTKKKIYNLIIPLIPLPSAAKTPPLFSTGLASADTIGIDLPELKNYPQAGSS